MNKHFCIHAYKLIIKKSLAGLSARVSRKQKTDFYLKRGNYFRLFIFKTSQNIAIEQG